MIAGGPPAPRVCKQFARAILRARGGRAIQLGGQQHVLKCRERGNQLVGLKDETDFTSAHLRQLVFVQPLIVVAVEHHLAGGGRIQPGQQPSSVLLPLPEAPMIAANCPAESPGRSRAESPPALVPLRIDFFSPALRSCCPFAPRAFIRPAVSLRFERVMHPRSSRCCFRSVAGLALAAGGCNGKTAAGTCSQSSAAAPPAQPIAPPRDDRPIIVAFGDSLTAGYGTDAGNSYPDFLERDLDAKGFHYRVVNAGISGNTTKDGVERLDDVIALKPAVVIVAFGGNDGLRGLPIDSTRKNLDQIVSALQHAAIKIVLGGITLPPNYGADYIRQFNEIYASCRGNIMCRFSRSCSRTSTAPRAACRPTASTPRRRAISR